MGQRTNGDEVVLIVENDEKVRARGVKWADGGGAAGDARAEWPIAVLPEPARCSGLPPATPDLLPSSLAALLSMRAQGRYQLAQEGDGTLRVRATQGHSVELPNPLHDPIRAPDEVPLALHATSPDK